MIFGGMLLQSLLTVYFESMPPDVTIFFFCLSVPGLSSDGRLAQPQGIDEVGSLQQVLFRASERFCKCGSLGPSAVSAVPCRGLGAGLGTHSQAGGPASHGQTVDCV